MQPTIHRAVRLGFAVLLLIAAGACGGRLGARPESAAAPAPCATEIAADRTPGSPPFASLGAGVAPEQVAFRGDVVLFTAFAPCVETHELVLWELDTRTRATTSTSLRVTTGGLWHALAVAGDGSVWVGTRDVLVHVHRDRSLEWIAVPAAQAPVPPGFTARAGASGAGAITALAAIGNVLLLGRAGHQELTAFDTVSERFAPIRLPLPFGEVKSIVAGPGPRAAFMATRSADDPLRVQDAAGLIDVPSLLVSDLPVVARTLGASGDQLAYAQWTAITGGVRSELGVLSPGGRLRWSVDAQAYDASRFAVHADGSLAVRLAGGAAEVAFMGADGHETRRVKFATTRDRSGASVPALALAAFGPDNALWFAVRGRPEIFRIR